MEPKEHKSLKAGISAFSAGVVASLYLIQRDARAFTPGNLRNLFSPVHAQVDVQGLQFSFSALTVLWPLILAFFVLVDNASRSAIQSSEDNNGDGLTVFESLYLTRAADRMLITLVVLGLSMHAILFVLAALLFTGGQQSAPQTYSVVIVILQGLTTAACAIFVMFRRRVVDSLLTHAKPRGVNAPMNPPS